MRVRLSPWILALLATAVCAGVLATLRWHRAKSDVDVNSLFERLPSTNALAIHLDFVAMRQAGLQSAAISNAVVEDPDYRRFVTESGFDWRTDLDAVTLARINKDWFVLASGRFDWSRLRDYAKSRGGGCYNGVCDSPGVTPGRRISFYPISSGTLALAASQSANAVYTLQRKPGAWTAEIPNSPAFVTLPGAMLAGDPELPAGMRLFAKVLAETERVTVSTEAGVASLELRLTANCRDSASAETLKKQLEVVTAEFQKYFERLGQKPNASDLSGALLAGKFTAEGNRLLGRWPLQKELLENLAAGTL